MLLRAPAAEPVALSIAEQKCRLGIPSFGDVKDFSMATMSDDNVNLTEYKAWDYSALGVVERLLQEYARHLAIERSRGCEPFSGLPNPWSRFQQWYKVMAQPSYMDSHYANKPWARTFLAELNRSRMLLRATTDRPEWRDAPGTVQRRSQRSFQRLCRGPDRHGGPTGRPTTV